MLEILDSRSLVLPDTPEQWLETLKQPSVVEFQLSPQLPWRIASTLIHGNEPSGFLAAFHFLKSAVQPTTNFAIVIASVRAARTAPRFHHRFVPGEFDLNRRFGNHSAQDTVTELASHITRYIQRKAPQCVVDFHNTSGRGPAFAVSVREDETLKRLASVFTKEMIVTPLLVGSLMEQAFACPTLTIECGGANDVISHNLALRGMSTFATLEDPHTLEGHSVRCFHHPARVKVRPGFSLAYGIAPNSDVDITLIDTIEDTNFHIVQAGIKLGWLDRELSECLTSTDENGKECITDLFYQEAKQLKTRRPMKIFMATKRADLALTDCLFYAVAVPETGDTNSVLASASGVRTKT